MKPTSFLALSIGCALVLAACGDKKSEASQRERTVAPSQSVHMSVETPEAKRVELPPVAEEVPAAGDELDEAAPGEEDEAAGENALADDEGAEGEPAAVVQDGDEADDEEVLDDEDEGDEAIADEDLE
ncbi:MAG: hypothetical protein H6713_08460 [Myxococcales bacterium]|nr:hypothetical protein [Myxococcales bacterium]MCB9750020.1 hypothetical protein [Myxococcales bacterium]